MSAPINGRDRPEDDFSSSSSEGSLDRPDSEGWEDQEPDAENVQIKDFFSDKVFPDAVSMIQYAAEQHGFDFVKIVKEFGLDFYGAIKLVNYIRTEAKNGNTKPDVSSKSVFEDDKYMQPALEDDALLFTIDDVLDTVATGPATAGQDSSDSKVTELEEELKRLQLQFTEYRKTVEKTLDDRWTEGAAESSSATANKGESAFDKQIDEGYFDSYSYNEIHQTMLQDSVRTDAYRDFIYANKNLFAGKTVLDVGCGTGILSLFCAKAGAARVIAVDNSGIITKAMGNIAMNGMSDRITCIRGKIEEISLPEGVDKVDIIVSEWMGYCLLYEAMLDSVLYARDKWLKPDGLMVPSHCTLHLAPVADPMYVADNFTFWKDVYGFDMSTMMEKIYEEVIVRHPPEDVIVGRSKDKMPFQVLDLHTVTVPELEFVVPFEATLSQDVDSLDAWCVWFDTLFLPSRTTAPPANLLAGEKGEAPEKSGQVFFTTGPFGKATHWQCGVCFVDRSEKAGQELKAGQQIKGKVGFRKNKDEKRAYNIDLHWAAEGAAEKGKQLWKMR